jgi:XTP/dITP diphosphohydrolase
LTREVRGSGGFGYDPLFLIPEYHKTFGELSALVKHQLSHRARAFARLRSGLERLITEGAFSAA